jgi:hypothetical protein
MKKLNEQLSEIQYLKMANNEGIVKYIDSWVEVEFKEKPVFDDTDDIEFLHDTSVDLSFEDEDALSKAPCNDDFIFINDVRYR